MGRLVCINKDASKLGEMNNIRGIAVNSIIIKLIMLKDFLNIDVCSYFSSFISEPQSNKKTFSS